MDENRTLDVLKEAILLENIPRSGSRNQDRGI